MQARCDKCQRIEYSVSAPKCTCDIKHRCFCGGILVIMSDEEIILEEERVRQQIAYDVAEAQKRSPLPKWCLKAIAYEAYERGHAAGQQEVDMIELGMIHSFEESLRAQSNG